MIRKLAAATAIGLVLAVSASCMQQAELTKGKAELTETVTVAQKVDNFRLTDETGKSHLLYALKDAPAVVLVMQGNGCPIVRKMTPDLEAIRARYAAKGVEFMMINSNLQDTRETIAKEVKDFPVNMPVLKDDNQLVGRQLGVQRTAEVFVLDPKTWKVVYHGPLNDRLTYGSAKAKASKNYASDALEAVLAGKAASFKAPKVQADGCLINFPERSAEGKAQIQKISYATDIAPIIEQKCVVCHQEGSIGPFALDRYETVKGFAPMIRETIRTDRMPPWDADPHVGKFKDDKSLSSDQIKTMVNWIEAGAPRGEGADPLAAVKRVAPEWPLGKPDLIVDIPAYTVPASGVVDYQYPVVKNPLTEGRWVKASTAKVGERRVVHHILSGIIPEGKTRDEMNGSVSGIVGGYTVGMESIVQPKGIGTYIPPGGEFLYQMHYTPYGKESVSTQQIGFYFYKDGEKPELKMREQPLVDQFIKIPPNTTAHKEVAYFNFPKDAILHTAVVHAHYRGNYSKLEVRYPDGKQETILNVPHYDFNWQRMYEFAEPVKIPAGSKVIATYIYDNSNRNPYNPDPSKEITWGDQSFEEMFYTSLRYRWADETAAKQVDYDDLMLKTRLMGMMDDNIDDKLQKSELVGFLAPVAEDANFKMADQDKDGAISQAELDGVMAFMQQQRRRARGGAAGGGAPAGGAGQ
jgi:thiol-disulfide isomerase/thioredoxin